MATRIPINRATFLLPEVALATRGTIVHRGLGSANAGVVVVSDSRACSRDGIFVALRGENHDGHDHVEAAIANGASIVVVEKNRVALTPPTASIVEVEDTLVAWGALAKAHLTKWRMHSVDGRVVAITGSAGKTTTKELTAALLNKVGQTHFTAGNLNNRIGVPAVIFALGSGDLFCVLEMGMSLPGELDAICEIAKPDVSVIVNIGVAHSEGVGGRDGVMHEKGAVYRALGHDGIAIVNTDDEWVRRAARKAHVRKVETFGRGTNAKSASGRPGSFAEDSAAMEATSRERPSQPSQPVSDRLGGLPHYRLIDRVPEKSGSRVTMSCAGRELTIFLPLPGEAAAIDLLAAIAAQEAVSRELLSPAAIEDALARVRLDGRGTIRRLEGDIVLLDDTYNANPASMRAALATLVEIASDGGRRRVAILGEMKELGALAEDEHDALGNAIVAAGIDLVIGCGGLMTRSLTRAKSLNAKIEAIFSANTAAAAEAAITYVRAGDAVLIKGSRSVGAEKVVDVLIAKSPEVWPGSPESATDGHA